MDIDVISKKLQSQGLQDRSSQREMIQAVFNALSQQKILCIEAPTGTGKTLSYALASLYAQKPKQYIIISTATIALQEQLMSKDLPLLSKLANKEFKYALAKGRRRYVCHARLYDGDNQGDLLDTKNHIQELQQLLEADQWSGDIRIRLATDQHRCGRLQWSALLVLRRLCFLQSAAQNASSRHDYQQSQLTVKRP